MKISPPYSGISCFRYCEKIVIKKKLENPKGNYADIKRTCKLHTEPRTILLWGRNAKPHQTWRFDDHRILSLMRKNTFLTSLSVKNTLEKLGITVAQSIIKRRWTQRLYNKVQMCLKFRHCQKTSKKTLHWTLTLWRVKTNQNLYENDGKRSIWRKGTVYNPNHAISCIMCGEDGVLVWATWCLLMWLPTDRTKLIRRWMRL